MSIPPNRGAVLFRTFLVVSGQTQADAARAATVSDVTVHNWIQSWMRPRHERRQVLEAWSRGAIPTSAWDECPTDAELAAALAAVETPRTARCGVELLHDVAVAAEQGAA
jgi:hypothetical protein